MAPCPKFVTKAIFINKLAVSVTVILTFESKDTETLTIDVGSEIEKQKLYTHEGGWTAVDPIEKVKFIAANSEKSVSLTAQCIEFQEFTIESRANGGEFNVVKKVRE